MKMLKVSVMGALLVAAMSGTAFAQWAQETSFAMAKPGAAAANKEYYFRVPPDTTIQARDGKTYNAGDVIGVPGSLLKLLSGEEAEKALAAPTSFANKSVVQAMTPSEKRLWAVISIDVPEGVTISHADGRANKGPFTAYMTVYAESLKASGEMAENPKEIHQAPSAFENK